MPRFQKILDMIISMINNDYDYDYIEFLNQFEQFNQLEELHIMLFDNKKDSKLKLTNLKFINFNCLDSNEFLLTLECPNLELFQLSGSCLPDILQRYDFIYPLSIKNVILKIDYRLININLTNLRNLESFAINTPYNNDGRLSEFDPELYPNLKSIHLSGLISNQLLITLRNKIDTKKN